MDLGFEQSGFEIVWANDCFASAVETYRLNFDNPIIEAPIETIASADIPDGDIILGGFPCQGFSVANMNRHTKDKRNKLYLEFVRIVRDKQPKFFVAENVKGILSLGKGEVFKRIIQDFADIGFHTRWHLFNSADYGVPQRRERVFILGIREDLPETLVKFPPQPTHAEPDRAFLLGLDPWVSVGEALGEIPEPDEEHDLMNHEASQYNLRFNGYLGHREIDPDKPCPTITARGDERGGVVIHHHPKNHRRLSARETALVQSFPIDFKFAGSKTNVYRQVGNAVPPLLAKAVAGCIAEAIQRIEAEQDIAKGRIAI
jgi:DNA (cytosine-5)-methyltransferase 1